MIVSDNRPAIEATGLHKETFFNVKQENLAHVFSILRNQLYSNKEGAIIREYCTNAFDAHVEAGIPNTPIEITVPTAFNSDLIIRDHGLGLSEDDIHNIFASYGESTKRNTNNQVGMMGLGSKSAFCYSDSFTVVSYHNGTKTTYSAFIDETGIGKISQVMSEPTDETGLSIQVPVKRYDATKFENSIFDFIKEFTPKPIIHNSPELNKRIKEYNPKVILSGTNWELRQTQLYDSNYVKMGNVFYPFTYNSIDLDYDTQAHLRSLYRQIIIHANIGDVKPSASRELLDLTGNTKNYLKQAIQTLVDELREQAEEKVKNSSTYWEALINLREVNRFFKDGVEFDLFNKKIKNYTLTLPKSCSFHRIFSDNKWKVFTNLTPEMGQTIFFYKGNVPRKTIFVRANSYIAQNNLSTDKLFLIGFDNETDADDWLKEGWLDGANVIDVASIPYVQQKRERIKQGIEKAELYEFGLQYYQSKNRDNWIARDASVLVEEGNVYIPLKYFQPCDCKIVINVFSDNLNHNLADFIKRLSNFDIKVPKIYGIQPKDIKNLPDDWISFDQFVQNSLDNMSDMEVKQALYTTFHLEHDTQNFWMKFGQDLGEDDTTGLYALVQEWQGVSVKPRGSMKELIRFGYQFDLSPIQPLIDKVKQMEKDFPLLGHFTSRPWFHSELVRYVKALS